MLLMSHFLPLCQCFKCAFYLLQGLLRGTPAAAGLVQLKKFVCVSPTNSTEPNPRAYSGTCGHGTAAALLNAGWVLPQRSHLRRRTVLVRTLLLLVILACPPLCCCVRGISGICTVGTVLYSAALSYRKYWVLLYSTLQVHTQHKQQYTYRVHDTLSPKITRTAI